MTDPYNISYDSLVQMLDLLEELQIKAADSNLIASTEIDPFMLRMGYSS